MGKRQQGVRLDRKRKLHLSRELLRATLDAWGLIPTPEDVKAFVSDKSPGAYEKLVDRLLASPAYGEKWGRRWLDVARYADSNGMDENLAYVIYTSGSTGQPKGV